MPLNEYEEEKLFEDYYDETGLAAANKILIMQ